MGWAARLPRRKIVTVSPDPIVTPQQDRILRGASVAALLAAIATDGRGHVVRPETPPDMSDVVKQLDFRDDGHRKIYPKRKKR